MAVALGDLSEIKLGFKSFLNDFFYVDRETIRRFKIEREFLMPIYKLADLDQDSFLQSPTPTRWLFHCQRTPSDLRGTGAGRYVMWGADQETRARKQSKESVRWQDAPALQGSKYWFWPAAPVHPTSLAIRKGFGHRYAPFIFSTPQILDQRLYLLFPKAGVDESLLQAYIASSVFPLVAETNADMGPGAGVLTFSTDSLRALPALDLRGIRGPAKKEVLSAAKDLFRSRPVDAPDYPNSPLIRRLDEALLGATGHDSARAVDLERQVASLALGRASKSQLRTTVRSAARKADVDKVARVIIDRLTKWTQVRRFPEDYFNGECFDINLPDGPLVIRNQRLLGNCDVEITQSGTLVLAATFDTVTGELILRCLQLGRRVFSLPTEHKEAANLLSALDRYLQEFEDELSRAVAQTGLGLRHEDAVRQIAMNEVRVPLGDLRMSFDRDEWRIQ